MWKKMSIGLLKEISRFVKTRFAPAIIPVFILLQMDAQKMQMIVLV